MKKLVRIALLALSGHAQAAVESRCTTANYADVPKALQCEVSYMGYEIAIDGAKEPRQFRLGKSTECPRGERQSRHRGPGPGLPLHARARLLWRGGALLRQLPVQGYLMVRATRLPDGASWEMDLTQPVKLLADECATSIAVECTQIKTTRKVDPTPICPDPDRSCR